MQFPFDRQRIGDMADVLDMKFRFDARPEFQGQKEESVRELYNWLREQDRKWAEKPKQAESLDEFREVAARLWCDPAMSNQVMDVGLADAIAKMLYLRIVMTKGIHPAPAISAALDILKTGFSEDADFARVWHDNIAVQAIDEGVDHAAAQKIASRFMRHAFGVGTDKHLDDDDEEDTTLVIEQTAEPDQPTDAQSPEACPEAGDPQA